MKKTICITLSLVFLLSLVCLADPADPLPVYIYGYEGAGSMSGHISILTEEVKNITLEDENDIELVKLLEATLISLEEKCALFEEGKEIEPVEITDEYNELVKIYKELNLEKEHVLLANTATLIEEIEKENSQETVEEKVEEKVEENVEENVSEVEECHICINCPDRAKSISECILMLKEEIKTVSLEDEKDIELLKLLEATLESMEGKCALFEEGKEIEPVEITDEYKELVKINDELNLGREHVLLANAITLIEEVEKDNCQEITPDAE